MMKTFKAWLTDDFMTSDADGYVHSVFDTAVNIKFENRLITLTKRHGLPDSVKTDEETISKFKALQSGDMILKRSKVFLLNEEPIFYVLPDVCCGNIPQINASEFLSVHERLERESGYVNGFMFLPDRQRTQIIRDLKLFASVLIEKREPEILPALQRCIGIGKGLTPSSDDAVIGILFAPFADRVPKIFDTYRINRVLDGLTTDVSLKYLYCAFEGRFAKHFSNLNEAGIRDVYSIGGTSGADMLWGIKLALGTRF